MLTFEQALNSVKIAEGQLLVPMRALRLDDDRLEDLFIYTARQLQNKRPVRAMINLPVGPDGVIIPDALNVLALKYPIYTTMDRGSPPIDRKLWWFEPTTKMLKSILSASFNIIYLRESKLGNFPIQENLCLTVTGESLVDVHLPCDWKHNTLKITKSGTDMVEVSRTGDTVHLAGTLGTGTVNLQTLKASLTLTNTIQGDLIFTCYNKRKAIRDIDLSNRPFMLMFTIAVLRSFGSLKSQATLDPSTGIPFNLQADTLLERARILEDQLQPLLNNNDKWYEWGI